MKFALLQMETHRGNICLAECEADSKEKAIELLRPSCPVPLDETGYARIKISEYIHKSFCVAESIGSSRL